MSIAGPFTCLDFAATPTTSTQGGVTVTTYPPLSGVFAITDVASYGRSIDALAAYRVTQVPAQHVLAGDDPANPAQTVTLQFADQATFDAVTGPVNALPPVAATPPAPPSPPAPPRTLSLLDFKLRIPAAKRVGVRIAQASDPIIADFMDLLESTGGASGPLVNLDDPDLQLGLGYLVSKGLLTADDVAVILA